MLHKLSNAPKVDPQTVQNQCSGEDPCISMTQIKSNTSSASTNLNVCESNLSLIENQISTLASTPSAQSTSFSNNSSEIDQTVYPDDTSLNPLGNCDINMTDINETHQMEDQYDVFGKYIASEMRNFQKSQLILMKTKKKILNALSEAWTEMEAAQTEIIVSQSNVNIIKTENSF